MIAAWAGGSNQLRDAAKMIGVALVVALAALAGGWLTGVVKDRDIAQLKETHATVWKIAESESRRRLAQAQARGDTLTVDLHTANAAAVRLQEQLHEEIALATRGRACLDAAALRVLDRAPGIAPARLPAPTGRAAATGGANAAADSAQRPGDDRGATDTDIASWALGAGGQYAECARRLDALIDWHDPEQDERVPIWK